MTQGLGANLAKLVGMSPTVFSRTRRQVVEAGWLEESERLAHISYYRLSAKSTGEDVVVPCAARPELLGEPKLMYVRSMSTDPEIGAH
ncbi:hypothetical protein ACFYO5_36075 [Streptomyces sp. NPDC006259]|uniref:hypothetical protein n=1 Tax=Streptomyces sp. NPDC006259 TaxID=3364740 RepID=UPI00368200B9